MQWSSLFKDVLRIIGLFIGGFLGLLVILFVYLDLTKTPDADVQIGRVDHDSTFYVGKSESDHEGSGQISLLATGWLNDTTASVLIEYTKPSATAIECRLPAGAVDRIYGSDFYDSRAKVTYRHGTVTRGKLRLRVALSYPPDEWGKHPDKLFGQH